MSQRTSVLPRVSQFGEPSRHAGTLSTRPAEPIRLRRRCKQTTAIGKELLQKGRQKLRKKICQHLAVARQGAPPAEVGKSSVGSMLTPLIGKRGRWRKRGTPRRIHRPGDRILLIFCLACHSNSSRFRIACPVNRLTGSRPPLRATPVVRASPALLMTGAALLPRYRRGIGPRQICR